MNGIPNILDTRKRRLHREELRDFIAIALLIGTYLLIGFIVDLVLRFWVTQNPYPILLHLIVIITWPGAVVAMIGIWSLTYKI